MIKDVAVENDLCCHIISIHKKLIYIILEFLYFCAIMCFRDKSLRIFYIKRCLDNEKIRKIRKTE